MTQEAQTILSMIEKVDPADTDTLDEIDARVWCWLNDKSFFERHNENGFVYLDRANFIDDGRRLLENKDIPKYTRSLDAIKAVEEKYLEGWRFTGGTNNIVGDFSSESVYQYTMFYKNNVETEYVCDLPTEQLARLHAVIQAIDYERNNG